jgi:hypothetical protein
MALVLFVIEREGNKKVESFANPSCVPDVKTSPEIWGKNGPSRYGVLPPNPRCNITLLGEGCTNIPEEPSEKYQSVCQKSINTYPPGQGFTDVNIPIYVMGRSTSRVRQCRNIISPGGRTSVPPYPPMTGGEPPDPQIYK